MRDHGRKRAAEILGVDRRTLDAALDQGALTQRIRGALEKALQSGVGSAAAQQRDRKDRLRDLEGLVEEQGKDMRVGQRAAEDAIRELREEQAQAIRKLERALAGLNVGQGGDQARTGAARSAPPGCGTAKLRREYPELVTLDPAEDDEEVFGDAWPLVQEWRGLKATHPNEDRGLDWLLTEERFLAVELALLEDHGLILPPETYPLKGLDRSGQVNWRRRALEDTQRVRKRRELLLRLRRLLTLGCGVGSPCSQPVNFVNTLPMGLAGATRRARNGRQLPRCQAFPVLTRPSHSCNWTTGTERLTALRSHPG